MIASGSSVNLSRSRQIPAAPAPSASGMNASLLLRAFPYESAPEPTGYGRLWIRPPPNVEIHAYVFPNRGADLENV